MFVHQRSIFITEPLKCSHSLQAGKSIADKIAFFSLKAPIFHIKGSDDYLLYVNLMCRLINSHCAFFFLKTCSSASSIKITQLIWLN